MILDKHDNIQKRKKSKAQEARPTKEKGSKSEITKDKGKSTKAKHKR